MTRKRIIRYVSHIISIAPFINVIIENYHIEGMDKFCNSMSDDLTIYQRSHYDIIFWLDRVNLLNIENKSSGITTTQGVHDLDF